jgi:hypothetical protein
MVVWTYSMVAYGRLDSPVITMDRVVRTEHYLAFKVIVPNCYQLANAGAVKLFFGSFALDVVEY